MRRIFILAPSYILCLSGFLLPALAQSYNDNYDPARSNVTFIPPGSNPSQGLTPPPGDGGPNNVNTVTPGDQAGTNPPVPTGSANTSPQYGTYFDHQPQSFRSRINLLVSRGTQKISGTSGVNRGTRVALTFQPDQLTSSQQSQIEGLLGLGAGGLFANEPYQNITVSTTTLEEIDNILNPNVPPSGTTYPYPSTSLPGADTVRNTPWTSRSFIAADKPVAEGYPRYPIREVPGIHPRQQIRDFCLYLVIAAVVVGCIVLVFVGAMMSFGYPYAGSKAIAAGGGIMLFLMAFTIWKADMFNFLAARGHPKGASAPDSFDVRTPPVDAFSQVTGANRYEGDNTLPEDQKTEADQDVSNPTVNLPAIPAPGTGQVQPRSGLPLLPLGSRH